MSLKVTAAKLDFAGCFSYAKCSFRVRLHKKKIAGAVTSLSLHNSLVGTRILIKKKKKTFEKICLISTLCHNSHRKK
jgi:hypothetical protein